MSDGRLYLDLLQLFLVGGVHLLQPLLQLPVSLQKAFPELGSQLQVCRRDGVKNHRCFSAHSSASLLYTWALCNQLCEILGLLAEIQQPTFKCVPHSHVLMFLYLTYPAIYHCFVLLLSDITWMNYSKYKHYRVKIRGFYRQILELQSKANDEVLFRSGLLCFFDYAAYIIVHFPAVPKRASFPQIACRPNSTAKTKIINLSFAKTFKTTVI